LPSADAKRVLANNKKMRKVTDSDYLESAGLTAARVDLELLAGRIVAQIQETVGDYRPKRARGRVYPKSHDWQERLKNYEWPQGVGFVEASRRVTALTDSFRGLSIKLQNDQELSSEDGCELQEAALRVFRWGGVTRGASKQDPSPEVVSSVVRSALGWKREKSAPMDSGWTKVAAFSTDWLEDAGGMPQVIYDSRVANSLIRNVEKLYETDKGGWLQDLQPALHQHLRQIQGRGGTRDKVAYTMNWKSGFGRWEAQYFASLLVRMMRDALNERPGEFGLMPMPDAPGRTWTTRGIEMVLFMDGY
jgi:hypothetical protein